MSLLKALITEAVDEAAISSSEAVSQRLGLVVEGSNREGAKQIAAVLFDPQKIIQDLAGLPKGPTGRQNVYKWEHDWADWGLEKLAQGVMGVIFISRPEADFECDKDILNIDAVAAQPGYGPLMYDIAMSLAHPRFLAPARTSVSKSALGVWTYYLNNRPDVDKVFISKVTEGDCPVPRTSSPSTKRIGVLKRQLSDRESLVDRLTKALKPGNSPPSRGGRKGNRPKHWDDPRWQKKATQDIEKYTLQVEKIKAELKELFAKDPMVWKFRIRKPLGIQRLIANADKFLQQVRAMVPGSARTHFKVTKSTVADAGDQFFQGKYRG